MTPSNTPTRNICKSGAEAPLCHPSGDHRDHAGWQGRIFSIDWDGLEPKIANSQVNNVENRLTGGGSGGIIPIRGGIINKPIEGAFPADVAYNAKELSVRQQRLLDKLPGYDSRVIVNKRDVSMLDLSALTAKTGDEFAMFTKAGQRLIVRGDTEMVPLDEIELTRLRDLGYRLSGHTHPGTSMTDLIASGGDIETLRILEQGQSVIYNALGKYAVFGGGE
jgi:hypothetical protein